jgi:hypothetical protein
MRKRKYLAWRAPIICSAIKKVLHPTSVVDFGCSIGDLVQGFNEISVPAIGFDLCEDVFDWSEPETPIFLQDIAQPLLTHSRFDLSLCVEVLRFIPDENFEGLLYNLYNHSKRVLIGYSGDRKKQLIERMIVYGFIQSEDEIIMLRKQLEPWKTKPAIKAFYYGAMYFTC